MVGLHRSNFVLAISSKYRGTSRTVDLNCSINYRLLWFVFTVKKNVEFPPTNRTESLQPSVEMAMKAFPFTTLKLSPKGHRHIEPQISFQFRMWFHWLDTWQSLWTSPTGGEPKEVCVFDTQKWGLHWEVPCSKGSSSKRSSGWTETLGGTLPHSSIPKCLDV